MFIFLKKSRSILGMNARNLSYIRPHNKRKARIIADEKIRCKEILKKGNIPVPHLITKITSREELENFDWQSLPESFVLKPNRGFGGEGIIIVYAKKKNSSDTWIKASGSLVTVSDLKNHILNILDGSYSLSNSPDIAFFEERLKLLKAFKVYAHKGIPDIRVIVYNKVPVMAMLRLPTKESDGKANLMLGGVGLGIDMATGTTTTALSGKNKIIETLPGSRLPLSGIKIPFWNEILHLAVRAQELSGLGFLGADVAIDRERGPVFLELNARPGLSIQIANLSGLKSRLRRVEGLNIKTIKRGVAVGKNLFGGEIEEELEEISGKRVISSVETVSFIKNDKSVFETKAKIDTGADSTSIDITLAKELGFEKTLQAFDTIDLSQFNPERGKGKEIIKEFMKKYKKQIPGIESIKIIFSSHGVSIRPIVKVTFTIDKKTLTTNVNITNRANLTYSIIVGKKNLKHFLVDVSK